MQRLEGRIEVLLNDEKLLEAIEEALRVEALNPPDPGRGRVTVSRRGSSLVIEFEARDFSSARAILNAFLMLMATLADSITSTSRSG